MKNTGRLFHTDKVNEKGVLAVKKTAKVSVQDVQAKMQAEKEAIDEAARETAAAEKQAQMDAIKNELSAQLDSGAIPPATREELVAYQQKFSNTIFFGDSMTETIPAFGFLDESRTVYHRGASIGQLGEEVQRVIDTYPSQLIMFTGLNDTGYYANVDEYAKDYLGVINTIKASLPDVKIYACSVLPPSDALKATRADLARSDQFDAALEKMCGEQGWTYIDTKWMVRQELYQQDQIHLGVDFYAVYFRYLNAIL